MAIHHLTAGAQHAAAPRTTRGGLPYHRKPPLPSRRPRATGLPLRADHGGRLPPLPLTLPITHDLLLSMLPAQERAPLLADGLTDQLLVSAFLPAPKPTAPSGVLPERPASGYLTSALVIPPSGGRTPDLLLGGHASRRGVRRLVGSGHRASRATLRQHRLGPTAEGICSKTAATGGLRRLEL
jgi:hypothetical protein